MKKDRVFANKKDQVQPFRFNREVAEVFDDMLSRSVPLYRESLKHQARMAYRFYQEGTMIYDLGCSHGNLGMGILAQFPHRNFAMTGIDASIPMIAKYRERLNAAGDPSGVELICGLIEDQVLQNASVVLINLTLQFLDPEKRSDLIRKIFNALVPGGVLLLTEKTIHPQGHVNDLELDFYRQFKLENGYSELEISQKREALEKVLVPESVQTHVRRLTRAGFASVDVWLKWFNFTSMLAIKHQDETNIP